MGSKEQDLSELITLVSSAEPDALKKLRTKYPECEELLQPGAVLGEASAPSTFQCDVALASLSPGGTTATKIRHRLRLRLAWSWRFDLFAKIAAACGSGGAVGILAAGIGVQQGMIAAMVALAGSICALIFSFMQRDEAAGSITDAYNRLITALVEAEDVKRALDRLCPQGTSVELSSTLTRANDVAKVLNELTLRYE
jgi:hypothetical protein